MGAAIIAHEVGKKFRLHHADRPKQLKELFVRGPRQLKPKGHFWALRQVSFEVKAGQAVGIIGRNGSGKSTLLRLISDIMRPDEGYVKTQGRLGALLDLGTGFHPDLTGRENVFTDGIITGLTRQEVKQHFDSIVAFAELEDFIDSPLRTYSSGMQMRLAFAIAVHTDPDILLIDEVLAVGDIAFQQKCLDRIEEFKRRGCTIVLVSHDPETTKRFCDEAIWLQGGELIIHDRADVVTDKYVEMMRVETHRRTPSDYPVEEATSGAQLKINQNRFGSLELKIIGVHLFDQAGLPVTELDSGEPLTVEIEYLAPEPIEAPIFGVDIVRADGKVCCDTSTAVAGLTLPALQGRGRINLHLERLDLIGNQYYVDVGVYEREWAYAYDYHWQVYPLIIRQTPGDKTGVMRPPHCWTLHEAKVVMELTK